MKGIFVKVTFGDYGKHCEFKTDLEDLKENDWVICDSVNGMLLGQVQEMVTYSTRATKWIIQKVDLEDHERRIKLEKRKAVIKRKMDIKKKEIEEAAIYKMLAEKDEDMAQLLKEYEEME